VLSSFCISVVFMDTFRSVLLASNVNRMFAPLLTMVLLTFRVPNSCPVGPPVSTVTFTSLLGWLSCPVVSTAVTL